jgi:purine nucleosidase
VGLDVTLQVRLTRADAERMRASGTPFAPFAGESTLAWIDHTRRVEGGDGESCAMHDPLAVAVVTHPELVTFVDAHVSVVTGDGQARGVMITDLLRSDHAPVATCRGGAAGGVGGRGHVPRALPHPRRRPLTAPSSATRRLRHRPRRRRGRSRR